MLRQIGSSAATDEDVNTYPQPLLIPETVDVATAIVEHFNDLDRPLLISNTSVPNCWNFFIREVVDLPLGHLLFLVSPHAPDICLTPMERFSTQIAVPPNRTNERLATFVVPLILQAFIGGMGFRRRFGPWAPFSLHGMDEQLVIAVRKEMWKIGVKEDLLKRIRVMAFEEGGRAEEATERFTYGVAGMIDLLRTGAARWNQQEWQEGLWWAGSSIKWKSEDGDGNRQASVRIKVEKEDEDAKVGTEEEALVRIKVEEEDEETKVEIEEEKGGQNEAGMKKERVEESEARVKKEKVKEPEVRVKKEEGEEIEERTSRGKRQRME